MATTNNIAPYKGEAVTLTFTMSPLVDVTGWAIVFTLKKNQQDAAVLVSRAAVITNGPAGQFTVSLLKADTNVPAGDYHYDVQRTDVGSETVLSIGTFTIQQEVLN